MLSIEEYIARRKKEDNLDEYDLNKRLENIRSCVNYVFEYFNNYINITEAEEKTMLKDEKIDAYRNQVKSYEVDTQEWLVHVYSEHGNHLDRDIGRILKHEELFLLFDSDNEFRSMSYECYSKLNKKRPY